MTFGKAGQDIEQAITDTTKDFLEKDDFAVCNRLPHKAITYIIRKQPFSLHVIFRAPTAAACMEAWAICTRRKQETNMYIGWYGGTDLKINLMKEM